MWGGQNWDLFHWSYFCYQYAWLFRILFGVLFVALAWKLWLRAGHSKLKYLIFLLLLIYAGIFYMTNHVMRADRIFYQPNNKILLSKEENLVPLDRLVLGVNIDGSARAYPIQNISYHHQVVDMVADEPIIVTYCNVCRTGRVFSSKVNGKNESFRLVGMSQWNAMVEDKTTGSWWQQATGEAIIGPLKGTVLDEFYVQQVTLAEWLDQYPESLVLQPDSSFAETYTYYEDYEDGKAEGALTRYDSTSWNEKSWVVGLEIDGKTIAYDWNDLLDKTIIQNNFNGTPVLLLLGAENKSFRAWNRRVGTDDLEFVRSDSSFMLTDLQTGSTWTDYGMCIEGQFQGTRLEGLPAYQEYWHSWQSFHANTQRYLMNNE